jgi:phenylacetate-CoA ligase
MPNKIITLWQVRQLRKLLRYTYTNVPVYKKLWHKKNITKLAFREISDLSKLPIIDKKKFRNIQFEEYVSPTLHSQWIHWGKTSGTSGEPFSFLKPNLFDLEKIVFLRFKFLYWLGHSPRKVSTEMIFFWFPADPKLALESTETDMGIPVEEVLANSNHVLELIEEKQPDVIQGFPSILLELARKKNSSEKYANIHVDYIVSYGEILTEDTREFLRKSFNCEVYSRYGLEEFSVVGTECKYHSGFHINVENFIVEIVDTDGKPVPLGKEGRVIITDLSNYVMPFIRYDTGDMGHFVPETCPCGLQDYKLKIQGRVSAFISILGTTIHHLQISIIMENFASSILQYQVEKTDTSTLLLRIIPNIGYTPASEEMIVAALRKVLPQGVVLEVHLVTSLKRERSGKCKTLLDSTGN